MRTAFLAAAVSAAFLTACGSDSPKVSSSEYLDRCKSEIGKRAKEQTTVKITDQQIADICKCTQDKLVAQDLGDKRIDDASLKDKGEPLGRECSLQVLTGTK
jgi:hypothetical protein